MNLVDDPNTMHGAFSAAADETGLPVRQLEKDFWVTAVLRAYAVEFGGRFLFKGGTSLSKGWKIISRFSEDIDLLLLTQPGGETDALLDAMTARAAKVCGSEPNTTKAVPGLARTIEVPFPQLPNTPKAPGMRRAIQVEPGVRGGPHPHATVSIAPLITESLPADLITPYDDLRPFEVDALHPSRTFVEKLFAIHGFAETLVRDPEKPVRGTEARHFYDLYFLTDPTVSNVLTALQAGAYEDLVIDCQRVSSQWFPERSATIPEGGFRNSPALVDEEIASRIAGPFERTMKELCYPNAIKPTFEQVRQRLLAITWL
jgi:hypothetical protein